MTEPSLRRRVVVVTGASRGIGASVAKRFASKGCVVAVTSRHLQACENIVSEITGAGGVAKAFQCDVREEADVAGVMNGVIAEWGNIDIVISNAGISGGKDRIVDVELSVWRDVVETNLTGSFLVAREAVRAMLRVTPADDQLRHLVFINSLAALRAHSRKAAYTAAKGGAAALAAAIAEEVRKHRINVASIFPGSTATSVLEASGDSASMPLDPNQVADAVEYVTALSGNSLVQQVVLERREEL